MNRTIAIEAFGVHICILPQMECLQNGDLERGLQKHNLKLWGSLLADNLQESNVSSRYHFIKMRRNSFLFPSLLKSPPAECWCHTHYSCNYSTWAEKEIYNSHLSWPT